MTQRMHSLHLAADGHGEQRRVTECLPSQPQISPEVKRPYRVKDLASRTRCTCAQRSATEGLMPQSSDERAVVCRLQNGHHLSGHEHGRGGASPAGHAGSARRAGPQNRLRWNHCTGSNRYLRPYLFLRSRPRQAASLRTKRFSGGVDKHRLGLGRPGAHNRSRACETLLALQLCA